jgi:hypothetical protein
MQFTVGMTTGSRWGWTLIGTRGEPVASSEADFPSQVQASAAAVAFAQLVQKASRSIVLAQSADPQPKLF